MAFVGVTLPNLLLLAVGLGGSQTGPRGDDPPRLAVGVLRPGLRLDGVLNEPAWSAAPRITNLTMVEPQQGATPSARTEVRVLADAKTLVFGINCYDPHPAGIVTFTKERDGLLESEDHVRLILGPYRDGRSGYIFAVNPGGARYDALVASDAEEDNSNWDGVWDAATHRDAEGWSVEIRIPIATLSFKRGLTAWHFNLERRVQRVQETDRWASPLRDLKLTQTSRAGLLTDLPALDLGLGLLVRPALVGGVGHPDADTGTVWTGQPSLDMSQRLGPNLLASATANTDFAETEVDTRQTNLTRFPLFFPEKRAFFLEGSDVFDFGLGTSDQAIPFFSRRIGLAGQRAVPLRAGGKLNGRVGRTTLGGYLVCTGQEEGVAPPVRWAWSGSSRISSANPMPACWSPPAIPWADTMPSRLAPTSPTALPTSVAARTSWRVSGGSRSAVPVSAATGPRSGSSWTTLTISGAAHSRPGAWGSPSIRRSALRPGRGSISTD